MRKFILTTISAISLTVGGALYADRAVAQPFFVRDAESILSSTLGHLVGGRNYCWYSAGWQGPGWYWCGYASRRGLGWGGGEGWHGWSSHGGGGGYAKHSSYGGRAPLGRGGQRGHVAGGGDRHVVRHVTGGHVRSGGRVALVGGGHGAGGHAGGHPGGGGHPAGRGGDKGHGR